MKTKDKIFIVTARSGFPEGYGAASIIRKYAKGFSELRFKTSVYLLRPSEYKGKALNTEKCGKYGETSYRYLCGSIYTSKIPALRLFMYMLAVIRILFLIGIYKKTVHMLFFYSPDYYFSVTLVTWFCRRLGIRCVGIKTESSICDSQRIKHKDWEKKERKIYRYFSQMVVISHHLKKQLINIGYTGKIDVYPILIDRDMFKGEIHVKEHVIAFCGNLSRPEEVRNIRQVCEYIEGLQNGWIVEIAGAIENDDQDKTAICSLKSVKYHGALAYSEVIKMLDRAAICILPRCKAEYSDAGFPIKLGEYLMSGAAVVVTDVGEISKYLRSGENALLCPTGDMGFFCKTIHKLLVDDNLRKRVGEQGSKLATEKFESIEICKRMVEVN